MEHGTNDNGRLSGSVVEASSPGGTACEANSPHMEHRTPRGVASTHPICVTTPEAAERGGGSQVQLVHRAGASLRLQTRPPRALAEEFTSPSETLQRAVLPGATQLQALAEVPSGASVVNARTWGSVAQVRASHWMCMQCRVPNPMASGTCTKCHTTRDSPGTHVSTEELNAILTNAQSSCYGRGLAFLQGKQQSEAPGVAARPGTAGYSNAIFADVRDASLNGRAGSLVKEIQPKVEDGVVSFDGWLALTTSGSVRIWEREQVRAFLASEDAEALTSEFIMAHTRTIREGGNQLVQVVPIVKPPTRRLVV